MEKVKVVVVGLGNMGISHAKAYHALGGFEIVGLCSRNLTAATDLPEALAGYPRFSDFGQALMSANPDTVSINTWPDTHEKFAKMSFDAGAHVFLEKPLSDTVAGAEGVVQAARAANKKLVVGYILRHHPSWEKLVEISHELGKPLVMRMNLNQQSSGDTWAVHKHLMDSLSPIVDCGVHYVDMMCLMTRSKPVSVHAIGARLSEEIPEGMYNYGHLQVSFEDGSIGWYEAGWGPMMSETAFFVKDVVGPKGCVSIVAAEEAGQGHQSDDVDAHTKTNALRFHRSELDANSNFVHEDILIETDDEPGHDELCEREQAYFLKAIREDLDLEDHMNDAVSSLRIVLAADQSIKNGEIVRL